MNVVQRVHLIVSRIHYTGGKSAYMISKFKLIQIQIRFLKKINCLTDCKKVLWTGSEKHDGCITSSMLLDSLASGSIVVSKVKEDVFHVRLMKSLKRQDKLNKLNELNLYL